MITITAKDIRSATSINDNAKRWALSHLTYLNKPMYLFGSSTKVEKGADKFDTYIMYLQPSDKVANNTLCISADSSGCKKPCLISSGQLGMSVGQNAATKRTILFLLRETWFNAQLLAEVDKAEVKAIKTGIPALFRLNGTSDIDFSDVIESRPNSLFYDYTKILSRVTKNTLTNYDLTFSASMYSLQSRNALKKALKRNYRIAVAFNTKGINRDRLQLPNNMVSFDTTDLRHLDTFNTVGYLKRKGSSVNERNLENKKTKSFFVTSANYDQFINLYLSS
jgi:hypothetical protein